MHEFEGQWCFEENIYKCSEGADAIVVLTEWEKYSLLDWQEISNRMRKPSWVFDSRSIISQKEVIKANLNFWRIGDGTIY